ncbi:MAG: biotin/lipoyl-binding protein [Burkholderiaceae bacterium]|nr:biotin/lipoyl-binding protein [Burkholderiaceae bacterium]
MQTRSRIGLIGGAMVLVALLAWAFAPRPLDVEVAQAVQGPFESAVSEDGKTRLRERYTVSAPLAGRLARIRLDEGDRVEAGAVLATLTPVLSPLLDERSQRELKARIDAAQANLARSAARLERARLGVAQARNDQQRSEQLAQQGFVAATRLETERLAVQAAQREVEAAEQERHVARHDLEQARAALAATQGTPGGRPFELKSPVAGQVLRVLQVSETTVALGMPLLELGDLGQLEVVAELLTADALATPPGSAVRIERWGGPITLQGVVRRVEPAAFTKVSALGVEEQRVRVLIDITSPPEQWKTLGDGYRVGVRIVTLALPQAVTVPVSAVFPLPGGGSAAGEGAGEPANPGVGSERQAVFVVDGGRARLKPVQVGARNGIQAWVREGLAAGAQVIVYPGAAVVDGARVKPRKV